MIDMQAAIAEIDLLRDEIDRLNRRIASSNKWYAVRIRLLEDFFRAEGQDLPIAKTFWDILANGHRSTNEPPTYDYILTAKDHEIDRLREENKNLQELFTMRGELQAEHNKAVAEEHGRELRAHAERIAELKDALIEERAFSMSAAASCPGGSPDCYGIDWDKIGEDAARKTLEKEGKL